MVQTLEEGINPNVGDINQKDKLIEKFDSMNDNVRDRNQKDKVIGRINSLNN